MLQRTDFVGRVKPGVKVKKVNNHALHGIHQCIVTEAVAGLSQSALYGVKVSPASVLLLRRQFHDGVLKQRQVSAHAVVALRRACLDELLRYVDDIHLKVLAFPQLLHEVAPAGYNHTVARLKSERLSVALESAISVVAVGVTEIVGKGSLADSLQCMVNDDVLNGIHIQIWCYYRLYLFLTIV